MAITINGSYAYVHCRPDSSVFYVGKGTGNRAWSLKERNRYHGFVVNKHGKENILVGAIECSDDTTAFELEKGIIKCLKQNGVDLANMTEGGEGFESGRTPWNKGLTGVSTAWNKGLSHSEETKAKISASVKEQMKNPERREINRKAITGNTFRRGAALTDDTKRKISESKIGKPSPRKGVVLSEEERMLMSERVKGKKWFNNGTVSIMCKPEDKPEGFVAGRGGKKCP